MGDGRRVGDHNPRFNVDRDVRQRWRDLCDRSRTDKACKALDCTNRDLRFWRVFEDCEEAVPVFENSRGYENLYDKIMDWPGQKDS